MWLLRYTLHMNSAPTGPAHKGEEGESATEADRQGFIQTFGRSVDGWTGDGRTDGGQMDSGR